jgi:putative glutamine transport system permease protein
MVRRGAGYEFGGIARMIDILQLHFPKFLVGFGYTLLASLFGLIGSLVLGTVFALLQVMPRRAARVLGRVYVELFRNIPLLVIVLFFYLVVTKILPVNGFWAGTFGLMLYTSTFIAETIRAGILSLDRGQMEGARANGLSFWQAMRFIVLPQAFRLSIPGLGNQFINLVKNSSILAFVAGMDLMYQANDVASTTFDTFTTYIIVALFYLAITLPISYYMRRMESKIGLGGAV